MNFFMQILQEGNNYILNFPGISRVIKDNAVLLLYKIKSYMVKLEPHASGIKSRKNCVKTICDEQGGQKTSKPEAYTLRTSRCFYKC